jgi:L-asparaginase II
MEKNNLVIIQTNHSIPDYRPVFEATRGGIVESVHYGAIAIVNAAGELLAGYGDPDTVTFLRSSAKPFQALPFIEKGGDRFFNFSEREIALICASHSGTDEHVKVVSGMQKKIGVTEADLMCGVHPPHHEGTRLELLKRGEQPTQNRHNCSGKHTGMLAHAIMRHLPIQDYINIHHPVQQSILKAFAEMCNLPEDRVVVGIDGCSAPNFAVPLRSAAWALARLCDPTGLPDERAQACRKITHSMTSNPDMVGGPGRFDTLLMELASGRILCKGGAEGYQALGLLPGAVEPGSPALGIAFKISDGDAPDRARPLVAVELLRQIGALSAKEAEQLAAFGPHPIKNFAGLTVGEYRSAFKLDK